MILANEVSMLRVSLYSPFHQQCLNCHIYDSIDIRYCVLISLFDLLILLCVHYCIDV